MRTCFKFWFPNPYDFCIIAVLTCYLYFIIYHMGKVVDGGLELRKKWGLDCF